MTDLVLVNKELPGITVLTMNRPEKRNALNVPLMKELCNQFEKAAQDHSVRVIVLQANGPAFCAGLDLHEAILPAAEEESAQFVAHTLRAVYECPAVTIAAVQGAAVGGGAGLMAAFDFVVATEKTQMGFPECRRGLVAAQIAPLLLRQLNGRKVRELLLLGELLDAQQALQIDLINRVVPETELLPEALKLAQEILLSAPGALRKTKKMLDNLYSSSLSADLLKVMPIHMEARQSPEAAEGVRAFFEKRDPRW